MDHFPITKILDIGEKYQYTLLDFWILGFPPTTGYPQTVYFKYRKKYYRYVIHKIYQSICHFHQKPDIQAHFLGTLCCIQPLSMHTIRKMPIEIVVLCKTTPKTRQQETRSLNNWEQQETCKQ